MRLPVHHFFSQELAQNLLRQNKQLQNGKLGVGKCVVWVLQWCAQVH